MTIEVACPACETYLHALERTNDWQDSQIKQEEPDSLAAGGSCLQSGERSP